VALLHYFWAFGEFILSNRALFLDRDGVINHDTHFASCKDNFKFIDGIFDLCRTAKQLSYHIFVVTNQSGIGRGYYSEEDFWSLTKWMCQRFESERAAITEVFYCPYHPEFGVGQYKNDSFDRKPNPGMFLRAGKKYQLDLSRSIMVGDKATDMEAAKNAGIGIRYHYLANNRAKFPSDAATDVVSNLSEIVLFFKNKS
jgi:D-glycero-D-manno-heptose 1,7-bisphosphate phosphatase